MDVDHTLNVVGLGWLEVADLVGQAASPLEDGGLLLRDELAIALVAAVFAEQDATLGGLVLLVLADVGGGIVGLTTGADKVTAYASSSGRYAHSSHTRRPSAPPWAMP